MIGKWVLSLTHLVIQMARMKKLLEEFGRRTRLPHTATNFGQVLFKLLLDLLSVIYSKLTNAILSDIASVDIVFTC